MNHALPRSDSALSHSAKDGKNCGKSILFSKQPFLLCWAIKWKKKWNRNIKQCFKKTSNYLINIFIKSKSLNPVISLWHFYSNNFNITLNISLKCVSHCKITSEIYYTSESSTSMEAFCFLACHWLQKSQNIHIFSKQLFLFCCVMKQK